MKIGILHKGDKVAAVTEKCVVVQRKNGEADILPIMGLLLLFQILQKNRLQR